MLNNIFDEGAKSHDKLIHRFIGLSHTHTHAYAHARTTCGVFFSLFFYKEQTKKRKQRVYE